MKIMLWAIDLIRVNANISYNSLVDEEDRLDQKDFVMTTIDLF